ncbi:hypothetical protein [Neobacillus niacini]|uniref:hypothetical protein n=1 Tax=Neobacillus niacini TaxID=86668 RepID=UPI002FFE1D8A
MSAFLVERSYLSRRGIDVNAGIAGIRQRRHIPKMNNVAGTDFSPFMEIYSEII